MMAADRKIDSTHHAAAPPLLMGDVDDGYETKTTNSVSLSGHGCLSAAFAVFSLFGTPVVIDVIRGQPLFPVDHPSASSGQATAELSFPYRAYALGHWGQPLN